MELDCKKFPNKKEILLFVECLKNYFYPCLFKEDVAKDKELEMAKALYKNNISDNQENIDEFFSHMDELSSIFDKDIVATFEGDPAADSYEEIVAVYPGFAATFYHRIAHLLYLQNFQIEARLISEEAHIITGIDIHPGATIGEYLMIDHGTGIVIGETTIIGNHVRIYQGVTLGALSLSGGHKLKNTKRHPTIGNNVTIYSGASILGGEAVIGDNVIIGSNVFLTESVPSNRKVMIKKPDLIVIEKTKK